MSFYFALSKICYTLQQNNKIEIDNIYEPNWEHIINTTKLDNNNKYIKKKEKKINNQFNEKIKRSFSTELSYPFIISNLSKLLFYKEFINYTRINKYLTNNAIYAIINEKLSLKKWRVHQNIYQGQDSCYYLHLYLPLSVRVRCDSVKFLWLSIHGKGTRGQNYNYWIWFFNNLPNIYGLFITGTTLTQRFNLTSNIYENAITPHSNLKYVYLYNITCDLTLFTIHLKLCKNLEKIGLKNIKVPNLIPDKFQFRFVSSNNGYYKSLIVLEIELEKRSRDTQYIAKYLLTCKSIRRLKLRGYVSNLNGLLHEKIYNIIQLYLSPVDVTEFFECPIFLLKFPCMFYFIKSSIACAFQL